MAVLLGIGGWRVLTQLIIRIKDRDNKVTAEIAVSPGAKVEIVESDKTSDKQKTAKVVQLACKVVKVSAGPSDDVKVRQDRAVAWLRENDVIGPETQFVTTQAAKIAQCGKGVEFQLQIGGALLKSGRPTILASWGGELFAVELSAEQAKSLGLGARMAVFLKEFEGNSVRSQRPRVRLEAPPADFPVTIDNTGTIKGVLPFKLLDDGQANYVLRARGYTGKSQYTRYDHKIKRSFPADGKPIAFDFESAPEDPRITAGPLLMFIELCSYTGSDRRGEPVVISNCVPLLVDFNAAENGNK